MCLDDLVNCGTAVGWALRVCHVALQGQHHGRGGSEAAPRAMPFSQRPTAWARGHVYRCPCLPTGDGEQTAQDQGPPALPLDLPSPFLTSSTPTQDPQDGTLSQSLRKGHRRELGREGTQGSRAHPVLVPIRLVPPRLPAWLVESPHPSRLPFPRPSLSSKTKSSWRPGTAAFPLLDPSAQPGRWHRVLMIHDVFSGFNWRGTSDPQDPGRKSAISRLLEIVPCPTGAGQRETEAAGEAVG